MAEVGRLTALAHGGGCGCKLAPAMLQSLLEHTPMAAGFVDLLVGPETSDDAAVWRLNDEQALVASTDFFTPIVDDPFDFGRIAAANALSDIYAMGARPIFALAIVGMPVKELPAEIIRSILAGGAQVCAAAGIPIAGGHSIDSIEPIYGLVALGLVHPDRVLTNKGGRGGDRLILTKALGVGILSAAFRQGRLPPGAYGALVASTTQLNEVGARLSAASGVHAVTDVTGFGLLGHALEMCRGANLSAELFAAAPDLLEGVEALARVGVRTGAALRNWESSAAWVRLPADLPEWRRDLLTDPQTSGGLLIAADPGCCEAVLGQVRAAGFAASRIVGCLSPGPPEIRVTWA
ncbi:MAG TPA: selenide, water dikinase SelD [Caulobacteraceae bacterium]